MTNQALAQLIELHGVDTLLADLRKITKPTENKGHYCPGCRSKNIYYLSKPMRYKSETLSGMGCRKCGCKWTRHDCRFE